jgi:hypothetical protein
MAGELITRQDAAKLLGISRSAVIRYEQSGQLTAQVVRVGRVPTGMIPLSDVERLRAQLAARPARPRRAPRTDTIAAMVRANAEKEERARVRASLPIEPSREALRADMRAMLEGGDEVAVGDTWEDPNTGAILEVTHEDLDAVTNAINIDEDEADATWLADQERQVAEAQAAFARMTAEMESASAAERTERAARAAYENETLDGWQLARWFPESRDELGEAVRSGEIRRVEPPAPARWSGEWRFNREDARSLRDRLERLGRGRTPPTPDEWTALVLKLLGRGR